MNRTSAALALVWLASSAAAAGASPDVDMGPIERNAEMLLRSMRENARSAEAEGLPRLFPRTFADGKVVFVDREDWCAGFFPGSLWFLYELTDKDEWLAAAKETTMMLEKSRHLKRTHDVGFILASSFGNGWRIARVPGYDEVLKDGASALATRFSPAHGLVKSWDWWETSPYTFPVIIDNMMNLDLLEIAASIGGDESFRKIARTHAATVSRRHFRHDGTVYHVLDYDASRPIVRGIYAGQGESVDGAWARGQAWALYGFTMMYRHSRDKAFLDRAVKSAEAWLSAPGMPDDGVPYWDFKALDIPNAPRDASAAACAASGLVDLSGLVSGGDSLRYRAAAEKIVASLSGPSYLARPGEAGGFILLHSTGNAPAGHEVDVPLSYADYYYLEALSRLRKIENGKMEATR